MANTFSKKQEIIFKDLQVGGQLLVEDTAVVTLADVVDNLTDNNVVGIPATAYGVFIQAKMYDNNDVEDIEGVLYYTRNGNDPTNTGQVGYVLYQAGTINLGRESIDDNASHLDLQNLKFIAKQGYKVVLEITYIGVQ